MVKIAIVNDSMLAVESLRRVLHDIPEYQLLWVANDGEEAVARCDQHCPDIILMDLIMPKMDGIEATRIISSRHDCAILVVTAIVEGYAGRVFEAMGAGALDAINTPVLGTSGSGEGATSLIRKIRTITMLISDKPSCRKSGEHTAQASHADIPEVPLIAIGASTGGPAALREILQAIPQDSGAAIAIIQHVDEQFTASFINWLNDYSSLSVRAARPGDHFQANEVLVCGREDHLIMTSAGSLDYTPHPIEQVYRPSVDVFFESLSKNYRIQSLAVLLTGMGKDGARGLKMLREKGWHTLAQDQDSCAVYGMPKAAKELDAAAEILALGDIGPRLAQWTEKVRATAQEDGPGAKGSPGGKASSGGRGNGNRNEHGKRSVRT
ncbi:two-component system response regulator WspF [Thiogranum longum]|uniref:Protein-glutamate methylesterase/protein-glutamine glutaminase n=1 Tax=Thiogranum longum TaxID=1537524 RepID=A0A4R1HNQ5_9GAMM|nr:chemotaxis response regulator protein-glutamate methylesterase [Thiogranum longum]TCK18902.1 two-component system response regulator WspF [Thiogranum longum]